MKILYKTLESSTDLSNWLDISLLIKECKADMVDILAIGVSYRKECLIARC